MFLGYEDAKLYTNIIFIDIVSTAVCPDSSAETFYKFVELVEAHLNFPFISVQLSVLLCFGVMVVSCEHHVNSAPWEPHVKPVEDTGMWFMGKQQIAFRCTLLLSMAGRCVEQTQTHPGAELLLSELRMFSFAGWS